MIVRENRTRRRGSITGIGKFETPPRSRAVLAHPVRASLVARNPTGSMDTCIRQVTRSASVALPASSSRNGNGLQISSEEHPTMSMSWAITVGTCCCVRSHGAATAVLSAGAVHGAKAFLPDSVDRVPTSLSRLDVVEKCFRQGYGCAAGVLGRSTRGWAYHVVLQRNNGHPDPSW
jgi:hypothetical protein